MPSISGEWEHVAVTCVTANRADSPTESPSKQKIDIILNFPQQ